MEDVSPSDAPTGPGTESDLSRVIARREGPRSGRPVPAAEVGTGEPCTGTRASPVEGTAALSLPGVPHPLQGDVYDTVKKRVRYYRITREQ